MGSNWSSKIAEHVHFLCSACGVQLSHMAGKILGIKTASQTGITIIISLITHIGTVTSGRDDFCGCHDMSITNLIFSSVLVLQQFDIS